MPLTPLTEDARASAREKAVLARAHRQEIKRALSERELSVRQVGAVRAERIIEELHIAPTRRLGGLGVHQRRKMVEYFNRNSRYLNRARRRTAAQSSESSQS